MLLPAEAKSTFAVVAVVLSAWGGVVALASAFATFQRQSRAAGAGVENVMVQLSTSVLVFGVVKLPALLFEPAVNTPVPTKAL